MERIVDGEITAKQNKENIQKKYETSSIAKYQINKNNKQFLRMKVETLCFMISRNLKLSSKNASQIESVYKALAKSIARNSQGRSCKAWQEKASGTSSST
jgi:hypothetical protein